LDRSLVYISPHADQLRSLAQAVECMHSKRIATAAKAGKLLFAHKRQKLTRSMMGGKLPFSLGRSPAASSLKFLSKGVSLARLHAPHSTHLVCMEPTQATAACKTCSYTHPYTCSCAHMPTCKNTHTHARTLFLVMCEPPLCT